MNGRIPTGSKILSRVEPLHPTLADQLFAGLSKVLAVFEDPIGLDRPLWRDYSYWQGTVNMAVAQAGGVYGMVSRAGVGRYYSDPTFAANYANAKTYNLYRSSYFVINPTQSVSSQTALWFAIHPEIDIIPRVIDLESAYGASPSQIADKTWEMSEAVLAHDGVRPIIYSRYLLVNSWLVPYWTAADLNKHFYWLAQYLIDRTREHAGPPTLPTGVLRGNVIVHQAADKKADFPGECSGSATAGYDRWEIGNAGEMQSWISNEWGGGEPPVIPQPLGRVQIVASTLNIRTGPGTTYADKGDTNAGQIWYFFEESAGWVRIGENNWISTGTGYSTIIQRY